jgi:hypothetical protein
MLGVLDAVESGGRSEWSGTGNAHTVSINRSGVEIVNVWAASSGQAHLSVDEFRSCILTWRRCLET